MNGNQQISLQYRVVLVVIIGDDRNAIIELEPERVGGVVHEYYILQITASDYSKIFYVYSLPPGREKIKLSVPLLSLCSFHGTSGGVSISSSGPNTLSPYLHSINEMQ